MNGPSFAFGSVQQKLKPGPQKDDTIKGHVGPSLPTTWLAAIPVTIQGHIAKLTFHLSLRLWTQENVAPSFPGNGVEISIKGHRQNTLMLSWYFPRVDAD